MTEQSTSSPSDRVPSGLKAYWRPTTGIFIGLLLFFMLIGQQKLFRDPGTFWHTIVGERLLQTRERMWTDSFTFTWYGHHWIPFQWLGEITMALAHRIDRLDTLLLLSATILAALYTWLAGRLIRGGLHWSLAIMIVMMVIGASASHFHVRPHLATIAFLGITMGFLVDFEAGRTCPRGLAWLIPIYLLWTNIHGGLLGGLMTMALVMAGWCVYRLVGKDSPITDVRRFLIVSAIFAACALITLVNPYGLLLVTTWRQIMGSAALTSIIVEHRPLDLHSSEALLMLPLAALYFAALLMTYPKWPRVTWLLPMVWLYLGFTRVRHMPLFAITAGVALADMLPYTVWAASVIKRGGDLFVVPDPNANDRRFNWRPLLLPVLAIVVALGLQMGRVSVPVIGHGWAGLDPELWPVELLPKLREHEHDHPNGTPIFNDYAYGGFLIYFTPGYRVFVDDRCELYMVPGDANPDKWLVDFITSAGPNAAARMREYDHRYPGFNLALVETRNEKPNRLFYDDYFRNSPEWEVVQRTPTATLYQRKTREK